MLADNMGYGDPGRYSSEGELRGVPTPRVNEFPGEGLRLSQFSVEPGCRGATAPNHGASVRRIKGRPPTTALMNAT
jgi:hypothetical protein